MTNLTNQSINGYTLLRNIGEGGMAEVWYAENRIKKKAAIKILKKEFCHLENVVARFENEASVMVELEHNNICQIFDYGFVEDRPAIIMQYLEGADLKTHLRNGIKFSDEQLVYWWNIIVDALNFTHSKNIIHRDIKPSNIFLTNDGQIKLLDFGIAKARDNITLTQTGTHMGTLMYMSPEQVKDSKHIDSKTDIYSLAVTFYHLLTGKAPYDNTNSSAFEIQLKIVSEPLQIVNISDFWAKHLNLYLHKESTKREELKKLDLQIKSVKPDNSYKSTDFDAEKTQIIVNVNNQGIAPISENFEITIGSQIWMLKNLNTDKFNNGNKLLIANNSVEWQQAGSDKKPACCYYNFDIKNELYGKLYNWYAVADSRGIVPKGYRVPNHNDLKILFNHLGGDENKAFSGFMNLLPNKGNLLLGGWVTDNGEFFNINSNAYIWSSEKFNSDFARYLYISKNVNRLSILQENFMYGLSVLCIKNNH